MEGIETVRMWCVEESKVASSEKALQDQSKTWAPLWWCLPSLFGFLTFLFAFPIDRRIPFWPHISLAEVFTLWFLFMAPVATITAIVTLMKCIRAGRIAPGAKLLVWIAIAVSLVVNAFILLGMAG
jgi:hypothetical protein